LIEIEGKEELCYVASSSKLNHYLEIEQNEILVRENKSTNSELKYRVLAIKINNEWIIVDLQLINRAVKEKYEIRGISVEAEKYIDDYRADLLIRENKETFRLLEESEECQSVSIMIVIY